MLEIGCFAILPDLQWVGDAYKQNRRWCQTLKRRPHID